MQKCWLTFVLLTFFSHLFSQITFQEPIIFRLYGCAPQSVLELHDSYLMASWGRTEYDTTLAYRAGIVFHKTDLSGNLLSEKIFNQPGKSYTIGKFGTLYSTSNGYLIGGSEKDSITGEYDFYLAKFDTSLNFTWMKKYPLSGTQNCWHGSLTNDGGYIMIGESFTSSTWANYYVLKADSNGNKQWDKTYGGGMMRLDLKSIKHQKADI